MFNLLLFEKQPNKIIDNQAFLLKIDYVKRRLNRLAMSKED